MNASKAPLRAAKAKLVFYDVENTLEVPFISGIQKVTREFSRAALKSQHRRYRFTPVVHDHKKNLWRRLDKTELRNLLSETPRSITLASRTLRKLRGYVPRSKNLYIRQFPEGSCFLDIDSSWHSPMRRCDLLPLLKKAGIRIVKLHHDIIPILFPKTTHPNTVRVFDEHFLSHLKYGDLFLCNSETTKQDVIDYCMLHTHSAPALRTIRFGYRRPKIDTEIESLNRTSKYGKYILCVSTIEPRKNHTLLIEAFERVARQTDLNLVIIGRTGWLSEKITERIQTHPLFESRIFQLSAVSDSMLDSFYENAWVCVMPSLYEGYGLPVAEALARSRPALCSHAHALKEVAGQSARYFDASRPEELAELLIEICSDTDAYNLLKQSAKDVNLPDWEITVSDIEDALDSLTRSEQR